MINRFTSEDNGSFNIFFQSTLSTVHLQKRIGKMVETWERRPFASLWSYCEAIVKIPCPDSGRNSVLIWVPLEADPVRSLFES